LEDSSKDSSGTDGQGSILKVYIPCRQQSLEDDEKKKRKTNKKKKKKNMKKKKKEKKKKKMTKKKTKKKKKKKKNSLTKVESREARVISRLPLRPRSAGTRMKSSLIS
jgi:hypothetical protein